MAFKEISVADILGIKKNEVVTTSPKTTIMEAARLLTAKRIGMLLVRKAGEDVVGLLSERDIIRAVGEQGALASDLTVEALMKARSNRRPLFPFCFDICTSCDQNPIAGRLHFRQQGPG